MVTKRKERRGRTKGSRNKGYFFRADRGWFTKNGAGRFVPLTDEKGERLRDENTPESVVKVAHARYLTTHKPNTESGTGVTLVEVCDRYLAHAEKASAATTVDGRRRTLFDLCYGFPAKFMSSKTKPKPSDRIHPGYGLMSVDDLRPHHIQSWQDAHKDWTPSGIRTRIQAVKRALNFVKEMQFIERNPLRGMKMPAGRARVTYLTDDQEAAILDRSPAALKVVLRVLIRTGMRPGELAKLSAKHVIDHGERMEFRLKPEESKTRRMRTIRVTETWIIELVRKLVKEQPGGHVFLNTWKDPWTVKAISAGFHRAVVKAQEAGVRFDDDVCLYSTRHTYAKRCLCGYWRGQHINIETLARLMGNSPQVCRANYLQWTEDFQEPLWAAC